MDIKKDPGVCHCCLKPLDTKGDHECANDGAWCQVHNAATNTFKAIARQGNVNMELEKTIAFTKGEIPNYRADLVLFNPVPGCTNGPATFDVTFCNEFNTVNITQASRKQGAAGAKGEKEKNKKYAKACHENGWEFHALAFDRMGAAQPEVEKLANYLIGERAHYAELSFTESSQLFWHDLAFAIQRANTRNIIHRYHRVGYSQVQAVK
jgi:hypothetical protein